MNISRRTKRMAKHHKRRTDRTASLNMVSLMDIFTILVFFLLVNATESEVLPSPKAIKLPESVAEKQPKENIIIMVNRDELLLQGQKVADVTGIMQEKTNLITPLTKALEHLKQQKANKHRDKQAITRRGITIMGDKNIPYRLLKKIMLSCAAEEFSNISLAVVHKVGAVGGNAP